MVHKISVLLGAAAVALGAGAGFADPFDNFRPETDRPVCASDSTCDQNRSAFGNGYSYGYQDGYAHRQRNDRSRPGAYDYGNHDRGSIRGSFYYISAAGGDSSNVTPATSRK